MSARGVPDQLAGDEARVPTYLFPEPAAKALARAVSYGEWRARPEGDVVEFPDVATADAKAVIDDALDRVGPEGGWLEPREVEAVLGAFGIPLAGSGVASSAQEAAEIAASVGGPVVLKVISPTAIHKSDIGGVVLDVEGAEAVSRAYEQVTSVVDDAEGVLVQEFVPGGHEVIVGMTEDPLFGPLLLFGLGGVYVELLADVAFRIHPLTDLDVVEMIGDVKSARLLEGYRGGEPGDMDALSEAMLRVSAMVDQLPEIIEMDLNPVKVLAPGRGIRVVDARIRVHPVVGSFVPSRKDVPAAVRRP
jgi:acyl-CoA synthetase (NDP forming)